MARKDSAASVFIIIPVHNRKATTLRCLSHLAGQGDLAAFHVVVVDDGSTDGTAQAVRTQYPQVQIISGDGTLWWTGAIALGMRHAYQQGAHYFVWLNDDTLPSPGALNYLVNYCATHKQVIASAQCYETAKLLNPTYGGHYREGFQHRHAHATPGNIVSCISLSGNLVCLPREVVDQVGYPPSDQTPHYYGDVLYTWRASEKGFSLVLIGDAQAVCPLNRPDPRWLLGETSASQQIRKVLQPKSMLYPPAYWQLCKTIWPKLGALVFLRSYIRLSFFLGLRILFPRPLLLQIKRTLILIKLSADPK